MITDNLEVQDLWWRMVNTHINNLKPSSGGNYIGNCPHSDHDDRHPSFSVHELDRVFNCFACGFKGDAVDFAKQFNYDPKPYYRKQGFATSKRSKSGNLRDNSKKKSENNNANSPKEKKVAKNGNYDRKTEAIDTWQLIPLPKEKCLTKWNMDVVDALQVHWSKSAKCLAFPVMDADGRWLNCWLHKPVHTFLKRDEEKEFHCQVYPLGLIKNYKPDEVTYLVEGFKDVLRMFSLGLQAICYTNGAKTTPKKGRALTPLSHLTKFTIIYDNDTAGEAGMRKQADALKACFPTAVVNTTSWKEVEKESNQSFTTGTDISDVSDETVGDLIITEKPYNIGYKLMTVEEMMNSGIPEPAPIVEHIIVEKGVTVFAATDGVGKSLLAQQLALSITRGVPFMGYFEIVNPRPVLLLNYELPDGAVAKRLRMQNKHFSQYPEKYRMMINTRDKKTIYADLWDDINTTITENIDWLRGGVVLIDNMYSTSDKDLSQNRDCKDWLQNLEPLKWEYNISTGLVAHYTKEWQKTYSILTKYPIEGGKTLTNYIDNGMVMGESLLTPGLRIGKIIKTRSSDTPLKDIPFKMHFDIESLTFEKGVIVNNEAVHFQPPKNRQEVEALKKTEKTIHLKHPNDGKVFFGFDEFKAAHLEVTGKENFSTSTVYEWLKRLKEWGYITQPYEGIWKIVPETLEDES